jgi:hypothetical protein
MGRRPAGRNGLPEDWQEHCQAWVERTCAEQGVPVKVTDRRVVAQVAQLLRESSTQRRQRGSKRDQSNRL